MKIIIAWYHSKITIDFKDDRESDGDALMIAAQVLCTSKKLGWPAPAIDIIDVPENESVQVRKAD